MSDEKQKDKYKDTEIQELTKNITDLQKYVINDIQLSLEDYKNINELLEKANQILQKYTK